MNSSVQSEAKESRTGNNRQQGKSKWDEKLQRLITPRNLALFLTAVYVLSLVPLLWIGWYNYPSADDYSIGSNCHQTWVATHNVFLVLWQGIVRAVDDWLHWMGYFTSNFLMAFPTSTFGERGYVLTVWIMLGMLSFSTIFFLRTVFVKVLKGDPYTAHSVAMLMLFASVQCMCPEGRVEAFYWYSGAVNYIFVHSMSLFFFGLLISAVYDQGKRRIWDLWAASFLGFFTGGGNQMTALNVAVVLLTAIGIGLYLEKKKGAGRTGLKRKKALWVPVAFFYLGFVLNVAAPGNWVRAEGASGMNPLKAVLISFYECLDRAVSQWTTWPVVVIVIILIPLFWHMAKEIPFQFPCPLLVTAFGYCLVSAMVTPPLFAVGNMEAGRLQALTYLMYILILTLCVGYVTGWLRKKYEERLSVASGGGVESRNASAGMEKRVPSASQDRFSPECCWCILGCIAFLAFGSALSVIPEPHYYTFTSALTDLSNGNAAAYGEALKKRMELFQSGPEGIVEVEPLPAEPVLLYFSDIKEDAEDWENRGLSRFYGIEGVAVKRD